MKIFATSADDNKREVMRLELNGGDVELLTEVIDRLHRLALIEDALEVKGLESPFIFGKDLPTSTREGARLLGRIVDGWDADEDIQVTVCDE